MLEKFAPSLLLVAALLAPMTGFAQSTVQPSLTLNGFGTLAVVHSDEEKADYVSNLPFAKRGVGHSGEWSAEVDSRIGIQATALFNQRFSAMVQLVTEQDHKGEYIPHVEWANLKFAIAPDFNMRVGRMMQSAFMSSEYRKVGYAMPWLRPPEEVYRIVPITYYDGVDLSYRFRIAETTHTLRASYGEVDVEAGEGFRLEAREGASLTHTLDWYDATLFAGYGQHRLSIDALNPFFDLYRAFGPNGEAIAERYDVENTRFETMSVGFRYDPGSWFFMGEWARSDSQSLLGKIRGGYITGGYRFGPVMPYITLARASVYSETSTPGLAATGIPSLDPTIAWLNDSLNQALASGSRQRRLALGARWDVVPNLALKAQYDHMDLDGGSAGTLGNVQPGFSLGGSANLVSIALDFVF